MKELNSHASIVLRVTSVCEFHIQQQKSETNVSIRSCQNDTQGFIHRFSKDNLFQNFHGL